MALDGAVRGLAARAKIPFVAQLSALLILLCAAQTQAADKVDRTEVFELCSGQPLLSSQTLRDMVADELRQPHDPELDSKPFDEIMDEVKLLGANECADRMISHPDAFAELDHWQRSTPAQSSIAWGAFNVTCKERLTAACIKAEVVSAELWSNSERDVAKRACSLVLPYEAGFDQLGKCLGTIGTSDPDNSVMLHCAFSGKLHSAVNAAAAGRKLGACFRASKGNQD